MQHRDGWKERWMDGCMGGWTVDRQTIHQHTHTHTHSLWWRCQKGGSIPDGLLSMTLTSMPSSSCCSSHSNESTTLTTPEHSMCDSWNQCSSSLLVPSSRPQWCGTPRRRCRGHKWPWGKWARWGADMSLVQEPQNGKFSIKKDAITLKLQKYAGSRCSSHPCCHPDHISPTWLGGLLSSSWWPSPGWSQHRRPTAHEIMHQGATAD